MTIHEAMDAVARQKERERKKEESVLKWDQRFLALARYWSHNSKDPSTKVGTVIARGKRPLSLAFNGFPQDVEDTDERLNNRELKYELVVHGEMNALNFVDGELHGCTLYNWPFMPCTKCAGNIIQRRVSRVVSFDNDNPRWKSSFDLAKQMFSEAGIELVLYENLIEVL